jgi:hypothetical protein
MTAIDFLILLQQKEIEIVVVPAACAVFFSSHAFEFWNNRT